MYYNTSDPMYSKNSATFGLFRKDNTDSSIATFALRYSTHVMWLYVQHKAFTAFLNGSTCAESRLQSCISSARNHTVARGIRASVPPTGYFRNIYCCSIEFVGSLQWCNRVLFGEGDFITSCCENND